VRPPPSGSAIGPCRTPQPGRLRAAPADGVASEETASAIRRFELDNGLPITGKPGEKVAARLVSIGAMAAN